jgi:hypothetical protein
VTSDSGKILGLDPTFQRPDAESTRRPARRPISLDGAVVGLISNGKGQATLLLEGLYDELANMANTADRVLIQKESVFAPPSEQDWGLITSRATVGVTAFGG